MRPSRFSDAQIVDALAEVTAGTPAVAVCRRLGITETTFYRWRKQRSGAGEISSSEVRALRDENQRLREIVANFLLDKFPMAKTIAGTP
ncbi:MAG: transposase [Gemmatimonadaceae bacterium]|nr:transposase [Gemmatimonadaceae bacterium]